jgi:hypothetical protein
MKATANVRMRKDSVIWISLSATLGIEALRCLITTDSIFVIDRVNKQYLALDYEAMRNKFNFDINYGIIQSIILGELPKKRKDSDKVVRDGDYFVLSQKLGDISIKNYVNSTSMQLTQVRMKELATDHSLNLNYGNFQYLEEYIFPYKSLVNLKYSLQDKPVETRITVDYNKAQIEEKEVRFPFNIPQKYPRINSI